MRKRLNNKGFSLVELLVSLAILAIISLAVVGFVSASTSSYRSISANVNLQFESQTVMAQLQEQLIDCNGGVSFSSETDTLYVMDYENSDCFVHIFKYVPSDEKIYYRKTPVYSDISEGVYTYSFADGTGDIMSSRVTEFNVDIKSAGSDNVNRAESVFVAISFSNAGKSYTGQQTIALRNLPFMASGIDALMNSVCNN